jgi:hypothetical protein
MGIGRCKKEEGEEGIEEELVCAGVAVYMCSCRG